MVLSLLEQIHDEAIGVARQRPGNFHALALVKDRAGDARSQLHARKQGRVAAVRRQREQLSVFGGIAAFDHLFEARQQLRNPVGVVFGPDVDRPAGEHRQRCRNGRDR